MQILSSPIYLKQNSKQVVLFKYASDSLLGSASGGVFAKFFFKTMFWKHLFKLMEELTLYVYLRFPVHHSHSSWMLLTAILNTAFMGWISHETWCVGKGEVLQLCLLCLQCCHPQFRNETQASVVLS